MSNFFKNLMGKAPKAEPGFGTDEASRSSVGKLNPVVSTSFFNNSAQVEGLNMSLDKTVKEVTRYMSTYLGEMNAELARRGAKHALQDVDLIRILQTLFCEESDKGFMLDSKAVSTSTTPGVALPIDKSASLRTARADFLVALRVSLHRLGEMPDVSKSDNMFVICSLFNLFLAQIFKLAPLWGQAVRDIDVLPQVDRIEELHDATKFILSSVLVIIHFISQSVPSMENTSSMMCTELLPPQPWMDSSLNDILGFDVLDIESVSKTNSSKSVATPQATTRRDSKYKPGNISNPCCNAFKPLVQENFPDTWSNFLIDIDSIPALFLLVDKLQTLLRTFVVQFGSEVASRDDNFDSKLKCQTLMRALLRSALVVQTESLFVVVCLVSSSRSQSYVSYNTEGPSLISRILLETSAHVINEESTKHLLFQRGFLCLRLNEAIMPEVIRRDSKALQSASADARSISSKNMLMPESVVSFFIWMQQSFIFTRAAAVTDGDAALNKTVEFHCEIPSVIPSPPQIARNRYAWPWIREALPTNTTDVAAARLEMPVRNFKLTGTRTSSSAHTSFPPASELARLVGAIEGCSTSPIGDFSKMESLPVPWFLEGISGRAWTTVFGVLFNTCFTEANRRVMRSGEVGRVNAMAILEKQLRMVSSSVLHSLDAISGLIDSKGTDVLMGCPMIHMHFIIFVMRSMLRLPSAFIIIARGMDLWNSILCGKYFLLGGVSSASSFMINHVQPATEDLNDGIISFQASKAINELDDASMLGFTWISLHDSIFDMFSELFRTCSSDSGLGFPRFEVVKLFESLKMIGKLRSDDLVLQAARYLTGLIDYGKNLPPNIIGVPQYLAVVVALNACGQQIVDSGIEESGNALFIQVGSGQEAKRPLFWGARSSLIELIMRVKALPSNGNWLDIYLSSSFQTKEQSAKVASAPIPIIAASPADDEVSGNGDAIIALSSDSAPSDPPTPGGPTPISRSRSTSIVPSANTSSSHRPGAMSKIPSVNTLRHLLSDCRCTAAVAFIFGEVAKRAAEALMEPTPQQTTNSTAASAVAESSKIPSKSSPSIQSQPSIEFDTNVSFQDSPAAQQVLRRKRTSTQESIDNEFLSSFGPSSSKIVASHQQLIYEIFRNMIEQFRIYAKSQNLEDATNNASILVVQLIRLFRSCNSNLRPRLQEVWVKRNVWSLLFGNILAFLKSAGSSGKRDASATQIVHLKLNFLHECLSLISNVLASNDSSRDSFKNFMISASGLRGIGGVISQKLMNLGSNVTENVSMNADAIDSDQQGQVDSSAFKFASIDPVQRKPYRFNEFRLMLSMILQPHQLIGRHRMMETILILFELIFEGAPFDGLKALESCKTDADCFNGGLFPSNDDRPKILNSVGVPILITILPLLHENDQIATLNTIHSLVKGRASLINLASCSQMNPSMLDLVLDVYASLADNVQQVAGLLLKTLGKHDISVSQLKRVFRMMQSKGDYRPAYTSKLLSTLRGMIAENEEPRHSFVFEGRNSGLQLPMIQKWPAVKAYTFSTWIRVEAPRSSILGDQSDYRPHVLSLRTRSSGGLDIYLAPANSRGKFKICLNSYNNGGECSSLSFPGLIMAEGKWHYFAVSQLTTATFTNKGEISVLLDDQYFRVKDTFPFPKFSEPIDCPLLGECPNKFRNEEEVTTMRGQLSSVYFFSDALSEGQLRGIRGLGPNYVYSFESYQLVHRDITMFSGNKKLAVDPVQSILDGSLTHLVMLAYNPAVWTGSLFLDNTPEKNTVKWGGATTSIMIESDTSPSGYVPLEDLSNDDILSGQGQVLPVAGKMHAFGRPGTYRNTTQDAKMALDSLGGIKVLLPLFAQFDQPRMPTMQLRLGEYVETTYDGIDSQLSLATFEVLSALLDNSEMNLRLLKKINGFALIAYFLERVSPEHMSMEALEVLWRMRERLHVSPFLQDCLVEYILANLRLWVYLPYQEQMFMANKLLHLCEESPSRLKEAISVQRLIDSLLLMYNYVHTEVEEPIDTDMDMSSTIDSDLSVSMDDDSSLDGYSDSEPPSVGTSRRHRSDYYSSSQASRSGQSILRAFLSQNRMHASGHHHHNKLSGSELICVRAVLLKILFKLINSTKYEEGLSPEDLQALLSYAIVSTSARAKYEALKLILEVIDVTPEEATVNVPRIFFGLASNNNFQSILHLQTHSSLKVRMCAFLIFIKILYLACKYKLPPYMKPSVQNIFVSKAAFFPARTVSVDAGSEMNPDSSETQDENVSVQPPRSNRAPSGDVSQSPDEELNFMDILGLRLSQIGDVVAWSVDVLCGKIRIDARNSNPDIFGSTVYQCRLILQALISGVLADRPDGLIEQVDRLVDDFELCAPEKVDNAVTCPDSVASSGPGAVEVAAAQKKPENDEQLFNLQIGSSFIVAPMLLPSILSLLRFEMIPLSLSLNVLINLKTLISQNDHNLDAILCISNIQDYILRIIIYEKKRLAKVHQKWNSDVPLKDNDKKIVDKSKTAIEICIKILCDMHISAVRLGRSLVTPPIFHPEDLVGSTKLKSATLIRDISKGRRQLGASVLRDTMSLLRMYGERGDIDAQSFGVDFLEKVLAALQHDKSLAETKTNAVVVPTADEEFVSKVLTLTKWLIGAVVFDFISVPIIRGRSSSEGVDEAKVRDRLRSFSAPDPMELGVVAAMSNETVEALQKDSVEFIMSLNGSLEDLWALVNSLLDMYGPLNNASWWNVVGMRLKAVGQIGLVASIAALAQINEGVEDILSTGLTGGLNSGPIPNSGNVFRISGTPSKSPPKGETPLVSTAYSVCWLLTRALERIFLYGGLSTSSGSEKFLDKSIGGLERLKTLMDGLENIGADFVDLESRTVISRITLSMGICHLPLDSAWVISGLSYAAELLERQKPYFVDLLATVTGVSSLVRMNSAKDYIVIDSNGGSASDLSESLVRACLSNLRQNDGNPSLVDLTLMVVRQVLKLPSEIDEQLTWSSWLKCVDPIVKDADRMSHESVLARLNELGLHRHSQELKAVNAAIRETNERFAMEISSVLESSNARIYQVQTDRLAAVLKVLDRQGKVNAAKWSRIVMELANERGPWGHSASDREIFWMMESVITNDFRRPLLKRNELGTGHRMATLIARGAYGMGGHGSSVTTSETMSASSGGTGSGGAQGLWRDLVKYQKKDSPVAEPRLEGGENAADQADGDADGENTEAGQATGQAYIANSGEEKLLFRAECEIITIATNSSGGSTPGVLEVYKSRVVFTKTADVDYYGIGAKLGNTEFVWACQNYPSSVWNANDIINVLQRHFQLRYVAVELFLSNRKTVLINVFETTLAYSLQSVIRRKMRPLYMQPYFGRVPNIIVQKFTLPGLISPTLMDAWQSREISNFDYLMHLNVIAGRTFNDLSQYPVFPWVIADYTSKKLDLKNPETFRDFRYPMGSQLEEQRIQFMDKYDDLKMNYDEQMEIAKRTNQGTDCLPPFHYGSHYSCMGFVLWYLIRHEPFTSLGVWLQDGKFDKADRLFDSIEAAYRGCTTNMSDVKELIPEFYYTSEFLDNYNNVDLGITQTGKQLGAVRLPRWAKNSQDFVHQNREALECEFVSANLHHWIDLIFGYKQKPPHLGGHPAAVDAVNVYFHLTYAGAVDLDQLRQNEPNLYSQTVRQIDNFGQTPSQLFDKPHPQRLPFEKCDIIWPMASVIRGVDTIPKGQPVPQKPRKVICFKAHKLSEFPILLIAESPLLEKLVTVDSSRIVGFHIWQVKKPDVVPPYLLKVDNHALRISQGLTAAASFSLLPSYQAASRERRIGVPFAPPQLFSPLDLAQTPVLYKLNRKLFCHEETERINQRFLSGARAAGSSSTKTPPDSFITSNAVAKATSDVAGSSTPSSSDRSMSVTSRQGTASKGAVSNQSAARKSAKTMDDFNEMSPESVMSAPKSRVDSRYSSAMYAYLPSMKYIFTCGHWDRSFKVSMADTGRLVQSVSHHRDIVTCLTFVSEFGFNWLVTGSRDCTVMVWEVFEDRVLPLPTSPLYVLYGHDEAVTCVSVHLELDVILSGSDDGSIIVHGLRDGGTYIRSIYLFDHSIPSSVKPSLESTSSSSLELSSDAKRRPPASPGIDVIRRVTWVGVSREGYIVSYSSQDSTLWTHTINGKFLIRREAGEHLHAFVLSEDGKVLITGGDRSLVVMRWVHNLELANDGPRKSFEAVLDGSNVDEKQAPMVSPIRSLYLTKKEHHLLVGLESGELIVMTQDSDYLRRRLHYKLMEIGILPQNHVTDETTF